MMETTPTNKGLLVATVLWIVSVALFALMVIVSPWDYVTKKETVHVFSGVCAEVTWQDDLITDVTTFGCDVPWLQTVPTLFHYTDEYTTTRWDSIVYAVTRAEGAWPSQSFCVETRKFIGFRRVRSTACSTPTREKPDA